MLQAIIFDVDGTLSETEEVHRAAFNEIFNERGLDWHWDQPTYARLLKVTGGKERIRHFIETDKPDGVPDGDITAWIADMHICKTAIYAEKVDSGAVGLRPGIETLIEAACSDGMRLAIATTTSLRNVESLIKATLGAEGLKAFEVISAGDMVERKKPAPDLFLKALEGLTLAPDMCVALEDSTKGIRSALGARIPTLITTSAYTTGEDFSGALMVVESAQQLAGAEAGTAGEGPAILASLRALHGDRGIAARR